jgi:peptide subunit release factor 1 (eRF1)
MRYQRHIEDHRDRHHREAADRLTRWVDDARVDSVLLSGQDRILANFQEFLPERVKRRILGSLSMDIRASKDEIQRRCQQLLQKKKEASHRALVRELLESVLTDGPAVVGVKETVRSLNEGKLGTLVVSRDFASIGALCTSCEMLHWEGTAQCPYCGGTAQPVSLEQELINAALQKGADAVTVVGDPDLERHGGVGAFLRYR